VKIMNDNRGHAVMMEVVFAAVIAVVMKVLSTGDECGSDCCISDGDDCLHVQSCVCVCVCVCVCACVCVCVVCVRASVRLSERVRVRNAMHRIRCDT
jgi:hypothetical protein